MSLAVLSRVQFSPRFRGTGKRHIRIPSAPAIVIGTLTALALAIRLFQFTRLGSFNGVIEYDDGPYFGSALELVNGKLPYSSYVLVQPPLITYIMAPAALVAKLSGNTALGMDIGRVLTALASTADVALGGLLVRRRGLLPVIVVCGLMAVYPASVSAAHTVLAESWLVLFTLLGSLAVFDGDRVTASTRRMMLGGLAFGLAGAVEAWAIVPVAVIAVLNIRRITDTLKFLGAVGGGFLLPAGPVAVLAPHKFYQDLIVAQTGYRANVTQVALLRRFKDVVGLYYVQPWTGVTTALVIIFAAGVMIGLFAAAAALTGKGPAQLEWFAISVLVIVTLLFLRLSQIHYHFPAFLAPFIGMCIGLPLATCMSAVNRFLAWAGGIGVQWLPAAVTGAAIIAMSALAFYGISQQPGYIVPSASIQKIIPPGSCVMSDQVSYLIMANRFETNVPGCPVLLDSLGADLALSHGLKPQTRFWKDHAVVSMWLADFEHAQYVWWSAHSDRRVPWTPALRQWFLAHFTVVYHNNNIVIYGRDGVNGIHAPPPKPKPTHKRATAHHHSPARHHANGTHHRARGTKHRPAGPHKHHHYHLHALQGPGLARART